MRPGLFAVLLLLVQVFALSKPPLQLELSSRDIPYESSTSIQNAAAWFISQNGIHSGVDTKGIQFIIQQLLHKPYFPLQNITNSYILKTDKFLDIEDKYLLINYITNYTHFAQSYVDTNHIEPQEFSKIIEQAKNENRIHDKLINHIAEYYSPYAKLDRKISNTKYGIPVPFGIIKDISLLDSKKNQATLYTRLFIRGDNKYRKYYNYTEKHNITSEMIFFDKILYHYKRENYNKIAYYITQLPATLLNSDIWWSKTHIMILHLIDHGFQKEAYSLLSRIHLNITHTGYMRKEMLTGAIAMILKKANYAFDHFYNIYSHAKTIDKKSQGAYFIAQSYKIMGNHTAYRYWINHATTWPTTFYGTRAIDEYHNIAHFFLVGSKNKYLSSEWYAKNEQRQNIYKKHYNSVVVNSVIKNQKSYKDTPSHIIELINIAKIMQDNGYIEYAKNFVLSSVSHVQDVTHVKALLEHICTQYNKYICADAKQRASSVGYINIEDFKKMKSKSIHPTIAKNHLPLLHAIIKKETNFKTTATSLAGARGVMQIMPSTAKFICSKHKMKYNYRKLQNDPSYSIKLGTIYLNDLLSRYNGSYARALAAYNAGHGNVKKWDDIYFKPSNYQESVLMIELIPFLETRDYVKKVLMWEGFYNYILTLGGSQTV